MLVGVLVRGADQQRLVGVEVRLREGHLLLALVGDGRGRGDHVAVAGGKRGDDRVEGRSLEVGGERELRRHGPDDLDVEAGELVAAGFVFVVELEGRVGNVRADGELARCDEPGVLDERGSVPAGRGRAGGRRGLFLLRAGAGHSEQGQQGERGEASAHETSVQGREPQRYHSWHYALGSASDHAAPKIDGAALASPDNLTDTHDRVLSRNRRRHLGGQGAAGGRTSSA